MSNYYFKNSSDDLTFHESGGTKITSIRDLGSNISDLSGQTETIAAALVTLDETKANADDLGGIKIRKISQSDYDALVNQGTVDPNTLYVVS